MIFLCIVFLNFLSSCYYDNEQIRYGASLCDTITVFFSQAILPILESNCYQCHSNAKASVYGGNVSLKGSTNLAFNLIPGDANASLLYRDVAWLVGLNEIQTSKLFLIS